MALTFQLFCGVDLACRHVCNLGIGDLNSLCLSAHEDFGCRAVWILASVSLSQNHSSGGVCLAYHDFVRVSNGNTSQHHPCDEASVVYRGLYSL